MAKWIDKTSYAQSDRNRTPRCWALNLPGISVTVHRHMDWKDRWCLSTEPSFFSTYPLNAIDLETAQYEALTRVEEKLLYAYDTVVETIRTTQLEDKNESVD